MSELRNYRLTVAFDGTDFAGWQCQAGRRTVQATLEASLESVSQCRTHVVAAGRTDAGVHAAGLTVSFRSPWRHSSHDLERALNAVLPRDVAVRDVEEVSEAFHARYSAIRREYRYRVYESPVRVPYLDRYAWRVAVPLDLDRMREASALLVGEADFRSFGQAPTGRTTVRTVYSAAWKRSELDGFGAWGWEFEIAANGFLRGMVRRIVGTLVQVGVGTISPDGMRDILLSCDPARAAAPAPAHGLFFWRACYPDVAYSGGDQVCRLAAAG